MKGGTQHVCVQEKEWLTGYEPNDTELNDTASDELVYSQGPLAYVTPSSDQDKDDTTLGKLLAEVHREYAD